MARLKLDIPSQVPDAVAVVLFARVAMSDPLKMRGAKEGAGKKHGNKGGAAAVGATTATTATKSVSEKPQNVLEEVRRFMDQATKANDKVSEGVFNKVTVWIRDKGAAAAPEDKTKLDMYAFYKIGVGEKPKMTGVKGLFCRNHFKTYEHLSAQAARAL
ncbi:MAG: hypothetical protein KVP17_005276 [Porospora cf. gigantea B]|uniref:uncharacterized protein n=1 Tax=Porospora cf. gigantea B TaxID=2853592 RepID=UPI0035718A2B|nr:MAG: hypothetical protein KVP17_005276 [Porospora cf. gigantea B]